MRLSEIQNLEDLRRAKRELKAEMNRSDLKAKNSFLFSTLGGLVNNVSKNSLLQNSPIGSGVNKTLGFLSNTVQNRFQLNGTAKTLLSTAVLILTPVIAKKIQDLIDKR